MVSRFKVSHRVVISCLAFLVMTFSSSFSFANDNLVLYKDYRLPPVYAQEISNNMGIIHISWILNRSSKTDEMTIRDNYGAVVYYRKRNIPADVEIIGRNIDITNKMLFTENYFIKHDNNVAGGVESKNFKRIIYDIGIDEFIEPFKYEKVSNLSINLRIDGYGDIKIKDIDDEFIIKRGKLLRSYVLDGEIRHYQRHALLVVPYLSFFNPLDESTSLFYLAAGHSELLEEYFMERDEFKKYMDYAETLKDVLFNFDLDRIIKSGNYKDDDIEMLDGLKIKRIITNLNTVIMWTALQTRDVQYIEKTYNQLMDYYKKKPEYMEYYLDFFASTSEPLPFDNTSIRNIIKNIKDRR